MSENCKHEYPIDRDGFNLCSDCGLVLDNYVFNTDIKFQELERLSEFDIKNSLLFEMLERDMISREVLDFAEILISKWRKENKPKKRYHEVFSVYYASRKLNYPITLKEICEFFQISVKKISELESIFNFCKTNDVSIYIDKFCGILGIKFKDRKFIESKCKFLEKKKSIQPIILLASVIYIFGEGKWSYKHMADVFSVCEQSIKKWVKFFSAYY